jgi:hypothetical protein
VVLRDSLPDLIVQVSCAVFTKLKRLGMSNYQVPTFQSPFVEILHVNWDHVAESRLTGERGKDPLLSGTYPEGRRTASDILQLAAEEPIRAGFTKYLKTTMEAEFVYSILTMNSKSE